MYNLELTHILESFKDLACKSFCKSYRKSLEFVLLDELIKIDTQLLKGNARMISEGKIIFDFDYIFLLL
jgi:hypothetical protein